jgi:hypothetical protein
VQLLILTLTCDAKTRLFCSNDSGNSRLVREDEEDHDVSDDEHGEVARGETKRIDFTVDTSARDQERRKQPFLAARTRFVEIFRNEDGTMTIVF